ncbi:hypothetical protein DICSQDRAFT_88061 [Dichomitus squalens LYAD-421 SS1]|uniref:Uncharacterized protein n=1 Tax=Dichomitus squalens (strain LYAD-421) TaxID=732165 RepID=R7SWD5_DICSQ|nr:uncharacterized protein DICSQDRAFT_88061 [Dichomitus squalens LYAD-421 SS1]EJF60238.1 hypothetical protein DICSQDRAFT_88061 [Dichomitus squalens LYAD-421 SS1]
MLNAFKIKAFDLEPIYAEWKDAPRFVGNPKKDLPVDDWLAQIKSGCIERKVPREYWHKVAQHYMADKAKARFDELKAVMKNMHGGKYRWTWKNFKIAMRNMGWDVDSQKTEAIEVQSKPSGLWWIVGRRNNETKEKEVAPVESLPPRPPPKTQRSFDFGSTMKNLPPMPMPRRSATMSSISSVDSVSSASSSSVTSNISSFFSSARNTPVSTPESSAVASPAGTPGGTVTTVSQVPTWLVNACQSLEYLTNEHPKVMTALSAVLITVGSLPALPAISAGAGGAFLASSTAHALGSLAVGLGTILQSQTEGKLQVQQGGEAQKSQS